MREKVSLTGQEISGHKIVLTADETLMSEYGGNIFFGFFASAPKNFFPGQDWLYYHFLCPQVQVDEETGEVLRAPVGLRRVEAKLLQQGFPRDDVIVAHPNHLDKVVGTKTKVIGVTVFDPLGMGPVTSTFKDFLGKNESYNMHGFRELIERIGSTKSRAKIIAGGPGSWQLANEPVEKEFGIDTVVLGEAENTVYPLFEAACRGDHLPSLVKGGPVDIEDIPNIVKPTIRGLVEVSRGCGRGCDFCNPTLLRLKCRSIQDILEEVKLNVRSGLTLVTLHSEDIFRYKANGILPNPSAVEELFKTVMNVKGVEAINVSHGAFASILSAPNMLPEISKIMNLSEKNWRAYEVGLETGSTKLVEKHMVGKCKPFKPQEWPEIVKGATGISNDANWMPCSTIVMGLPGETSNDIMKTLELVDDLKSYKVMFYPLFFVPLGCLSKEDSFTKEKMSPEHYELFYRCWETNLSMWPRTFKDLMGGLEYSSGERAIMQLVLNFFVSFASGVIKMARKNIR